MNITLEFIKLYWKWAALAGCIVLGWLVLSLNSKLSACQYALNVKPQVVTQYQTITQTAKAHVVIQWRDKEIPCPDISVDTETGSTQTQGQTQTAQNMVCPGERIHFLAGGGYAPVNGRWAGMAGAEYGPAYILASHPIAVEFSPCLWAGYRF